MTTATEDFMNHRPESPATSEVIPSQTEDGINAPCQHEEFHRSAEVPSSGFSAESMRGSTGSPQTSARSRSFFGPVKNEGILPYNDSRRFSVAGPQISYAAGDHFYGSSSASGGAPTPLALPLGPQAPSMGSFRLYSTSQPGSFRLFSASQPPTPMVNNPGMNASGMHSFVHTSGDYRVLSERVIEHSIKVPKKVTREDVIERMVMVPEKIVHEEIIEDVQTVRERVVEMAVPVVCERIVEVPEVEYVEKIVEVPEIIVKEKFREVPRVELRERVIEVPKIVTQERFVEVPDVIFRDYPVEKIVEVPEIREQIVYKEVPVPQYVEKPVPQFVEVVEQREIQRRVPIPVEAVTTCEFKLPRLRPHYTPVDIPLYIPRFVEVAVPVDTMSQSAAAQADMHIQHLNQFTAQKAVSLTDVGSLAHEIENSEYYLSCINGVPQEANVVANLVDNWVKGRLQIDPVSMTHGISKGADTGAQPVSSSTKTTTTITTITTNAEELRSGEMVVLERSSITSPPMNVEESSNKEVDTQNAIATVDVESNTDADQLNTRSPFVVSGFTRSGVPIISGVIATD